MKVLYFFFYYHTC